MAATPTKVDEGGRQHGLNKTGRDKHAGGNGQIGLHEHVGLGLTGKHGVGQDRATDGERQTGQHGLDDRALPYGVGQRLARVLRDKVQPAAGRTDECQGNKPGKLKVAHPGSLIPPPMSWPSSR